MKKPKRSPKEPLKSSREFIKYSNIAMRMIVIILAGVFGGMKLDEYLSMERPVFTMILAVFSVAASMYVIIREISSK